MSLVTPPDSWSEITLGEINQYRSKNVQPKDFPEESFELWSVPIFPKGKPETLSGIEIGSSKQAVEPRDVLICKINPRINRVWEVGQKSRYRQIASSEWIVVRQPLMEPRYLLRFFQSDQFRTKLCADVTGVGGSLTRAQPKKVATFGVVVPPRAEQKVIADKLDILLAQVENTKARLERIPQILKRFRQSVLAAAVSGRLTEEWRDSAENQDFEPLEIPASWKATSIGAVAEVKGGKRLPKGEELVSENTGYPYIRAGQLKKGTVITGQEGRNAQLFITEAVRKVISRYTINAGDAYITIVGASIGDAGIVPESHHGANLTENAAKITKFKVDLEPSYLSIWLRSEYLQDIIRLETKSAAQGKLALSRIKTLPFPLPPIEEQTEIVRRVDQLFAHADRIEQQVNNALARVNNLTQSILAKAFRGELTEQWRKDNPELISGENSAAALLERIKAERAVVKPTRKSRKKAST